LYLILLRALPSNSRGLSALGISDEDEEKQQHFCYCSSPFYSAACVGSLLSVALFGCIFSMVKFFVGNSFTQFIFHTLHVTGARAVKEEINDYIVFFNEQRPAYSLNYPTPVQFRMSYAPATPDQ